MKPRLFVQSDSAFENLVVEIELPGVFGAIAAKEPGQNNSSIYIFRLPQQSEQFAYSQIDSSININLDDFLEVLIKAKKELENNF